MSKLKKKHDYEDTFIFYFPDGSGTTTKALCSRTFEVEVLEGTEWELIFYPKGCCFQNFTSLYLRRTNSDTNIDEICVDFSFECKETHNYVEFHNINFVGDHCWGSPVFSRVPLQKSKNIFNILFGISKRKSLSETDVQSHESDLEALSKDLSDSLMGGELFDLKLICDGIQFLVHKCILAARCSKLDSCINEQMELATVIRENISIETLKIILFYMYSAKLILPRAQISAELYVSAMLLEMTDLLQHMHNHPYFHGLKPKFNVDHLKFDGEIDSETLEPSSETKHTKMYSRKLTLNCRIERVQANQFCILVSFNFDTFDTGRPIFLDFILEVSSNDRILRLGNGSHVFFTNEKWERRIGREFCQLPKELKFECRVDLCDGLNFKSNHRDGIIHVETSRCYRYYNRLPVDMLSFLQREFFSDFLIVSNDKKEFRVHRTIMAARSSVFQRMLHHNVKETITGRMVIDDIDSATLQLMIVYMYSGLIAYLDLEESLKLYKAADKYDIQPLVLKCTHLILSNINRENKQDAISFIEDFNYDELRELINNEYSRPKSLQVPTAAIADFIANYLKF